MTKTGDYSELRMELSLPGSGLNERRYPHIFPSVPVASAAEQDTPSTGWQSLQQEHTLRSGTISSPPSRDQSNQENSWLFYLAEIALRRIMNRVLLVRYKTHVRDLSTLENKLSEIHVQELRETVREVDLEIHQW